MLYAHYWIMLTAVVVGLAGCRGAADTTTTNAELGVRGCSGNCGADACQEWFTDLDGDGYGVGTAQMGCGEPPPGFAKTPGDCCDLGGDARAVAANINPGQQGLFSEPQSICPSVEAYDYDCSGTITDQIGVSVAANQAGNCGPDCDGSGWVLDVGCGQTGSLVACSRYQGNCAIDSRSPSQRVVRECN